MITLPEWATSVLPHQADAIEQVIEAYESGVKVVVLDGPTGAGKTLIADVVRQRLEAKGLYVCSDKGLQDQFLHDFPESRVIKGRANYLPQRRVKVAGELITCDDCTGPKCVYCASLLSCPYIEARRQAMGSDTAVLNSAYFLSELNGPGRFTGRKLVVVDEADTLEPTMMRWVEVTATRGLVQRLGVRGLPGKGSHQVTIVKWVAGVLLPALEDAAQQEQDPKRKRTYERQAGSFDRFLTSYDRGDVWVRENRHDGGLVMKPVEVNAFGGGALWRHGDLFLLMSASVISAKMMLDGLGWKGEYGFVQVPMTFPVENRPVIVAPVAEMTRKGKEAGEWEKIVPSIKGVLRLHPGERVLVHAVSYELTKLIAEGLIDGDREVFWYTNAQGKQNAVDDYAATPGSVLVAPSLDRGVDFTGDLCRVVVIAKVPYPSLGDVQVSARMHSTAGGQMWYNVETVRTLVQMTGRGVRSSTDHATSYILDRSFLNVLRRNEHLFPQWWTQALVTNFNPNTLRGGER